MNLYRVISETLYVKVPILDDGSGPDEPYAIARLIAAETPGKARWAAWRSDKDSYGSDPRDMPRFSVRKARANLDIAAGDYTGSPEFQDAWDFDCREASQ